MKEIYNITKKYFGIIMFVIILLVLLANCDLTLPSYTSNIVNVGIQQNGIEYATPIVIRKTTYDKIISYLPTDSKVLNNYSLISKNSLTEAKYDEYIKIYPSLKNEDLYVLDNTSKDNLIALEDDFSKALVINTFIEQYKNSNFNNEALSTSNFDTTMVIEKIDSLGESIISQYAMNSIKNEYEAVGFNVEKLQMNYIYSTGFKMLLLTLAAAAITICNTYLVSKLSASISKELRSKVVTKVMTFSNEEFEDFSASSLITRTTNDIQQVQTFITMGLRIVIFAPIMGVGAFLKVINSSMSWVILVALLAIFLIIIILFTVAVPKFKKVQELLDKTNLVSREILTGLPVIRAFSTEKYEMKRFDVANMDLTKVNLFVNKVMSIMMPTMMFIMNGINILIIWVGSKKIDTASIQIGDLFAFIQYSMHVIISFLMISILSIMIPRAIVSLKRIAEILDKDSSIKDKEKTKKYKDDIKGVVEFKNVSFKYPDANENVLSNISFKANKGETVAFIGSTGSGKSTLINLIPRFFDVSCGEILVDGINIKDVELKKLREKIGYVPQKGILFSGTIESNLKLGNDKLSNNDMQKVCEVSQAKDFVESNDLMYDASISQGGTNVSGGQKQRLAIARAIAINPEIYIFDDSFSALDFKTDSELRKALKNYTKDSTILIVAQRISSIMNADQIIVLDQGEIVGSGTHSELIKTCQVYKEIACSQLGEGEV